MNHARDPTLLLRQLIPLVVVRSSPGVLATQLLGMCRTSSIGLVADENMAEFEYTINILGCLDNGLVLEHRRDEGMSKCTSCRIRLLGEES